MITLQDLIDRFGESELQELSDKDHYQHIDHTVINHAIDDATDEVASYLQAVGLVRMDGGTWVYSGGATPKALTIKTCDIARYYLYEDGVTEIVEQRYKQAVDWLKLVMRNPEMLTGGNSSLQANSGVYVIGNPQPKGWFEE